MKIANYQESPAHKFDNENVKGVTGRVVIGKEDQADNFCMRVFTVAPGGFTPRHSHEWEHEIFVHSGNGEVFRDGGWTPVTAGNIIFVPGNEEHQIRNNGSGNFIFVCLIPSGAPEL